MKVNDRARYAFQYYVGKGIPPAVAAGIVGNFAVESGNFADDVLSGERRGDKGTAHYVQQLRGDRVTNFKGFAQETGRSVTDFDAQLDFFLAEAGMYPNLQGDYTDKQTVANLDNIMKAESPEAAASAVMQHYERASSDPKLNHINVRQGYAAQLLGQAQDGSLRKDEVIGPSPVVQQASYSPQPEEQSERQTQEHSGFGGYSAGDGLIMAGNIMMGKRSSADFLRAPLMGLPQGEQDDRSVDTNLLPPVSSTAEPSVFENRQQPLGMQASLTASQQNQFGPKPVHDGVDLSGADPMAMQALTQAATYLGRDIPITSGYRSQAKQDGIRRRGDPNRVTVAKKSYHTDGKAFDIPIKGMSDDEVANMADAFAAVGFTGFGYYGSQGHLHVDMRSAVPNSFDPDKGWGGWTKLPPAVMKALVARGYRPGMSADKLTRGFPGS